MTLSLIYPMYALVLLTSVVLVVSFRARVNAVKSGRIDFKYFGTFEGGTPTEDMIKTSRHFSNLFETPILFYAGCLSAMVAGVQGPLVQFFAWGYVGARIAHAYIHIGHNRIRPRMLSYSMGWLMLHGLWICIIVGIST